MAFLFKGLTMPRRKVVPLSSLWIVVSKLLIKCNMPKKKELIVSLPTTTAHQTKCPMPWQYSTPNKLIALIRIKNSVAVV